MTSDNPTAAEGLAACPNPWCLATTKQLPVALKREGWRVVCACGVATHRHSTEAEAIAAWNTRAPAVSEEAVERVSAAIEDLIPWSPGTESRRGFPSTDAIARAAIDALSPTTPTEEAQS